jgi:hypothetical protein
VLRVDFLNDKGQWITIATPNQQVNICSVAAGADAADLMANANIPTGKYVNFRIVLSNVMVFAGTDGIDETAPGGTVTLTGIAANAASTSTWPADPPVASVALVAVATRQAVTGNPGDITATLNLGAAAGFVANTVTCQITNNLATPIEVKDTSTVSMAFQFNTQNTVWSAAAGVGPMFFTPPQTGTSYSLIVDGATTTVAGANMQTNFNQ